MEIALELSSISKSYPGTQALNKVSFKVKKGSIHGFLGPNGAGKSTCMKIISGLLVPTSGSVTILGSSEVSQEKIGFLPENPPLYSAMKVKEYLKFVLDIRTLKGSHGFTVDEILHDCGLTHVADRAVGNLSKGYKQRVGIAQALIHNPEIIILDEPTVGLDPVALDEMRNFIKSLKNKHTVLLSTHLLHEVKLMCDEITIINKGHIVESGPIEEIQRKYTPRQIVNAQVKIWNDVWQKEMEMMFDLEVVRREFNNSIYSVECMSRTGKDTRDDISRYFIQKNAGLIGLSEKEQSLEDLFKVATSGDLQ